jgi:hypothetical protein
VQVQEVLVVLEAQEVLEVLEAQEVLEVLVVLEAQEVLAVLVVLEAQEVLEVVLDVHVDAPNATPPSPPSLLLRVPRVHPSSCVCKKKTKKKSKF